LKGRKLLNRRVKRLIENALKEDLHNGDITTEILFNNLKISKKGIIKSKSEGIIAGIDIAEYIFKYIDNTLNIRKLFNDGDSIKKDDIIMEIEGNVTSILKAERTALNFLIHMSGIATLTNEFIKKLNNPKIKILDTRKTLPNLREIEKYSVKVGGGENHRYNLGEMVLIKENHLNSFGDIKTALKKIKTSEKLGNKKVEIEIERYEDLKECIEYPPDIIMLDNMSIDEIKKSIEFIRKNLKDTKIEVSGGITIDNIENYKELDIDFISIGTITHSARSLDFSLLIEK